jgi:hypothetical protein
MTKALQSPPGYAALLRDIKERVRTAQMRATLAVKLLAAPVTIDALAAPIGVYSNSRQTAMP